MWPCHVCAPWIVCDLSVSTIRFVPSWNKDLQILCLPDSMFCSRTKNPRHKPSQRNVSDFFDGDPHVTRSPPVPETKRGKVIKRNTSLRCRLGYSGFLASTLPLLATGSSCHESICDSSFVTSLTFLSTEIEVCNLFCIGFMSF